MGPYAKMGWSLMQTEHVAELVQRAQQLVTDVQQVAAQRCGHAPQVPLVILNAPLQRRQRVVRLHAQIGQIGARLLGPQQLLHEAVHLFRQRLVQVVGGLMHGVVVRAPVVQLDCVQHLGQRGHYAVGAVAFSAYATFYATSFYASLNTSLITSLNTSLNATSFYATSFYASFIHEL